MVASLDDVEVYVFVIYIDFCFDYFLLLLKSLFSLKISLSIQYILVVVFSLKYSSPSHTTLHLLSPSFKNEKKWSKQIRIFLKRK